MSLFMNNRLIVSKQYQSTFWFSKYRIVSILFRFCRLLELGVSFVALNYINLSLMQIHTVFYFNYIIYSGLLVFCCQNVATFLLYQSFQN